MPASYQTLLSRVKRAKLRAKSDVSLLHAFSRGDASAFELFYSRHKDVLFNSLCNQLGNTGAAEEVAQNVWMAVIKGSGAFDGKEGSIKSWLFSIAYRRAADYWRKQYREKDVIQSEADIKPEGNAQEVIDHSPDLREEGRPDHQHSVYELRQLLGQLPEEQRQSFILREEGFSYQEIADITETGIETVKSRLRYAKKTLKEWLADDLENTYD